MWDAPNPPASPGPLVVAGSPDPPPDAARGASGWAPWTAPVALLGVVAAALLGGAAIAVLGLIAGANLDNPPPTVNIGATALQDAALVVVAILFARLGGGPADPWDFGLRPVRWRTAVGWMFVTWLGFLVFSAVWVSALGVHESQEIPDELGADQSSLALAAVAILVTVIAPLCEEIFFRGYFFRALRNWHGLWPAAIVTGVVFGGVHAGSSPVGFLVPLAFLGFALCLLYWRTGSLLPGIALHALNNSLALGVAEGWDWQVPLLMAGALAVIALVLSPFVRGRSSVPQPA